VPTVTNAQQIAITDTKQNSITDVQSNAVSDKKHNPESDFVFEQNTITNAKHDSITDDQQHSVAHVVGIAKANCHNIDLRDSVPEGNSEWWICCIKHTRMQFKVLGDGRIWRIGRVLSDSCVCCNRGISSFKRFSAHRCTFDHNGIVSFKWSDRD
jgi:hypothetical protein